MEMDRLTFGMILLAAWPLTFLWAIYALGAEAGKKAR